jgi:DNA-binding winged helix-turn-helix (wHTH) protein
MSRADSDASAVDAVAFGSYILRANSRSLERDGIPVQLGDRAFDILCVLTARSGQIVTNRELMAEVWGRVVVGAGSLRFHINALRKVLAQDGTQTRYIRNVTRRGYTFTAAVRKPVPDLPGRPLDISARAEEIKEIARLLSQSHLITRNGRGPIRNATVAESAALISVILDRIALR